MPSNGVPEAAKPAAEVKIVAASVSPAPAAEPAKAATPQPSVVNLAQINAAAAQRPPGKISINKQYYIFYFQNFRTGYLSYSLCTWILR